MPVHPYPIIGKYINPLVDFAFKKIFGSEPNKDLLIAFLNEVFQGRKVITDLTYSKNDHPGNAAHEGGAIFDLLCTGSNGEEFLIEVQRGPQPYFKERALFYTSRLVSNQAPKGKRQKWAYDLKEVYLVALLENTQLPGTPVAEYLHQVGLSYLNTGKVFYEKLGYTYIELAKFNKTEAELATELDKWLYLLKHLSEMDELPVSLRKPIFEKLFQIAEYTNLSKEEQAMYDSSLKYKWDNENVREYEIKLAVEEATATAVVETEKKVTHSFVEKMKNLGFSAKDISATTGLSEEEIEKNLMISHSLKYKWDNENVREYEIKLAKNEEDYTFAKEMKNDGIPYEQIARYTKLTVEEIEKL